ncbi:MauE/DoxX family redox-associated membrane protein [Embleya sp. NPDC056575]|uniref:MauE/DoxX family redox-associated membrane protein n=1 Tax=unclassified Embleya TaxID=2699296 RepID=UPI0036A87A50
MHYLELGIRSLIAVVFLASSVGKTAGRGAFGAFVASLRGLELLPAKACRPVALLVVVAEYAVWLLLLLGSTTVAATGFLVAAGLLVMFATAIALTARRGIRPPCRCFGASSTPLGARHIVRNVVLAAVACLGAVTVPATNTSSDPGALVVAILAGLLLGAVVALFDDILELFEPLGDGPGAARRRP